MFERIREWAQDNQELCLSVAIAAGAIGGLCVSSALTGSRLNEMEAETKRRKSGGMLVAGIEGGDGLYRRYAVSGEFPNPVRKYKGNPQYIHNHDFLNEALTHALRVNQMALEEDEKVMPIFGDLIHEDTNTSQEILLGFLSTKADDMNRDPSLTLERALTGRFLPCTA